MVLAEEMCCFIDDRWDILFILYNIENNEVSQTQYLIID